MRRLHPLSAVRSVGAGLLQGAFFGFFVGSALAGAMGLPGWTPLVLAPAGALVAGGYALARHLRFRYEIAGDTLTVESGVFARQSREIPLGRIQNVDAEQNVLNRLLGLAAVSFETAGGSTTEATLNAVDTDEADRLRRLVQRHGGSESVGAGDGTELGDTGAGPTTDRETLFAFSTRDLLTYAVVSIRPTAPVIALAGLPLGGDLVTAIVRFNLELVTGQRTLTPGLVETVGLPRALAFAALVVAEFLLAALVVSVVLTVVEYHDFHLFREDDDLRYERGLVRRYSGTIPLSKVQTVSVRENALMRRVGYATLVVETAGYSGGNDESSKGVAVPMAPREDVVELARDVEPFGDLSFERPPERARRRYAARFGLIALAFVGVAYAVDALVVDSGRWWLSLGLLALVPPAAHLRWRNRGVALGEEVFATRSGFWRRTTRVVPYYRIQTVFVERSPFQRRRHLATVTADTASTTSILGGSATAYDVDDERAATLRDHLRDRLYEDLLSRKRDRAIGPTPEDSGDERDA
ncbi:PH domain-containing protein [Haloarcula litorea]|uniref:PH domain-containing protein n=1 Tax=Haloarcula litorea TaxID=3032579 RepID=UPI0023E75B32|nr:PH domain-containing protein [Halomicroarcula sp. GDY20]